MESLVGLCLLLVCCVSLRSLTVSCIVWVQPLKCSWCLGGGGVEEEGGGGHLSYEVDKKEREQDKCKGARVCVCLRACVWGETYCLLSCAPSPFFLYFFLPCPPFPRFFILLAEGAHTPVTRKAIYCRDRFIIMARQQMRDYDFPKTRLSKQIGANKNIIWNMKWKRRFVHWMLKCEKECWLCGGY